MPRPNTYVRALEAEPELIDFTELEASDSAVTVPFTADFDSGEVHIAPEPATVEEPSADSDGARRAP
jgi:hypothetical protein